MDINATPDHERYYFHLETVFRAWACKRCGRHAAWSKQRMDPL